MVRETPRAKANAMMRKARKLVAAMSEAEANAFLTGTSDARKAWMIENLDGCWGQSHAQTVKEMVGKKLGLLNR